MFEEIILLIFIVAWFFALIYDSIKHPELFKKKNKCKHLNDDRITSHMKTQIFEYKYCPYCGDEL